MNQIRNETHAIWFVLFLSFLFIVLTFVFSEYQIVQIKNSLQILVNQNSIAVSTPIPYPSLMPMNTTQPTSSSLPTPTGSSSAVQVVTATQPPSLRITYVPLTGGSTQNTDWTNIPSSGFMLNFSDYGPNAYAVWDASLRVDNANGTTYARLFDTTHGIAVNGSQISVSATSTSTDVVSSSLQFWAGNNSYIIQVKSLSGSNAFVDSGRIKINY